jgi:hypothetical protein
MSGMTLINNKSGSAQSCINYLEGMIQSNGEKRDFAPVNEISGDKDLFLTVAESTERENKYVSGTISFEQPLTEKQIKSVIKEFHQTFLPGLNQGEDFADYWNIHQKNNGQFELNFAIATTHIKSGKQLNPFPPGTESRELKDLFDSIVNHELGLNQVNQIEIKLDEDGNPIKTDSYSFQNPMKTGTYSLLKQINSMKVKNEQGKLVLPESKTDFFKQLKSMQQQKDFVADYVRDKILDGSINNRLDLKNSLGDLGEITRENDFTVSVKLDGKDKAIRLNGPMFEFKTDYDELKNSFKNSISQNKNANQKLDDNKASLIKMRRNDLVESRGNFYKKVHSTKKIRNKSTKRKMKLGKNQKKGFEKLGYKFKEKIPSVKNQPQQQSIQKSETTLTVQDKQLQDPNVAGSIKDAMIAGKKAENEANKNEIAQEKKDQKVAKKPSDPIIIKNGDNKESKNTSSKPSISAFSQVATSSSASLLTVQINQVLFSKLSLELQIGSLSIFKESDIKKIFELKQKIADLEQQISVLKAKQEQAIEAELINQNANRFKNNSSSMKLRI